MSGVNKVIVLGNLGKDPEVKTLDSGLKVASFSVATSEKWTDKSGDKKEETEWHNIVFFGKVVDVIEKYVKKGQQIYVEGKLKTTSYEDKEGIKRYQTRIIGNSLNLIGGNSQGGGSSQVPVENFVSDNPNDSSDDLPF
jgi:single-strand DNA-binding protein